MASSHRLLETRPMGVVAYAGTSLGGVALMFVRSTFWLGTIVAAVPLVLIIIVYWSGIVADWHRKRVGTAILIPLAMVALVGFGGFQATVKFLSVDLTEPHARYLFGGLGMTKADKAHSRPVIVLVNNGQLPMRFSHAEGFVDVTTDPIGRDELKKEFNSALWNLKTSRIFIANEISPGQNTAVPVGLKMGKEETALVKSGRALVYVMVAAQWKDDNVHGNQSITYEFCGYSTGDLTGRLVPITTRPTLVDSASPVISAMT